MKKVILFLSIVISNLFCFTDYVNAQATTLGVETPQSSPATVNENIIFNYTIFLPENYNDVDKVPVYFHLHGNNGQQNSVEDFVMKGTWKVGKLYKNGSPYLVIRPRTKGPWNYRELSKLWEYIKITYKVDLERVYLSGYSFGGRGAWDWFVYERSLGRDTFAAVVSTGAAVSKDFTIADSVAKHSNTAMWLMTGYQDPVVNSNVSRQIAKGIVNNGLEGRLTILPKKGHNTWGAEFDEPDYFNWINAQKLIPKTKPASFSLNINFMSNPIDNSNVLANFGVNRLGSVNGNWNNLDSFESAPLVLSNSRSSKVTISIENAEGITNYLGTKATALQAGAYTTTQNDKPLKVALSNLTEDFKGKFKVIVFLTGQRTKYSYLYQNNGNIKKDDSGDYIYEKVEEGNLKASISDDVTTYYYRAPDIYGMDNVNNLFPYMLTEATLEDNTSVSYPKATFAVFGPYENQDELTLSLSAIEGGSAAIGGIQVLSLEEEEESPLGILNKAENKIKIYPNPASDRLFIDSEVTVKSLKVLNTQGQLLHPIFSHGYLDTSTLPLGVYILEINGHHRVTFIKE